ncbi:MAG TPA: hypothetical protein VG867_00135 [Rhizomicrobium sp.]|nr:hypothetical protein [Rhizomicrobium sp.]
MANTQAFGRRAASLPRQTGISPRPVEPTAAPPTAAAPAPAFDEPVLSVEEELRQWKAQRGFKIPWRQLSLMASLCFGIASFELPDSVNDEVNWLLYGLMAISFYVGVSGWFKKRVDAAAERKLRDSKS